jgi:hypothetical protein
VGLWHETGDWRTIDLEPWAILGHEELRKSWLNISRIVAGNDRSNDSSMYSGDVRGLRVKMKVGDTPLVSTNKTLGWLSHCKFEAICCEHT